MSTLAVNKQAGYSYELQDKLEAGLKLTGAEVKSAKAGQVSLRGAYVSLRFEAAKPVAYLIGAHVTAYKPAADADYNPTRPRQLLLKKNELKYLLGKGQEKGLTLVPTRLYTKGNLVKLELAVARGKKLFDKRESIKKRDIDRDIKRKIKGNLN